MISPQIRRKELSKKFTSVSGRAKALSQKPNSAAPFSLRLTDEERTRLKTQAGTQPLGAYIRRTLLGSHTHKRRIAPRPSLNNVKVAQALAGLGHSNLASNMNQIAKAANIGVIDVSPDLVADLQDACQHLREMRDELISALHVKTESGE